MTSLRITDRIGSGQFADVFALPDPSRVCKLYRAAGKPIWRELSPRIQVEELRAYAIAAGNDETRPFVVMCYGAIEIAAVADDMGVDISDRYLLSLGVELERVSGEEDKVLELDEAEFPDAVKVVDTLHELGVNAMDASAVVFGTPPCFKVFDITTFQGVDLVFKAM